MLMHKRTHFLYSSLYLIGYLFLSHFPNFTMKHSQEEDKVIWSYSIRSASSIAHDLQVSCICKNIDNYN